MALHGTLHTCGELSHSKSVMQTSELTACLPARGELKSSAFGAQLVVDEHWLMRNHVGVGIPNSNPELNMPVASLRLQGKVREPSGAIMVDAESISRSYSLFCSESFQ